MRKRLVIATGCLAFAAAIIASPAWARWGCQATDSAQYNWFAWGAADEDEARTYTLKQLCEPAEHGGCRIVECRSGVDDQKDAEALWSNGRPKLNCIGNAQC
jgi:hypothetical protein